MTRPELNGLPFGLASMIEKQPQIRLSRQACLKAATSGPSSVHRISGRVSIDRPCSAYSGKTTRSIVAMLARALATIATMRSAWAVTSARVAMVGSCSWTRPMTTPFGDLFSPPSPFMRLPYLRDSSPGAPVSARSGEEVAIRSARVRT